jgi:hypothetical protein
MCLTPLVSHAHVSDSTPLIDRSTYLPLHTADGQEHTAMQTALHSAGYNTIVNGCCCCCACLPLALLQLLVCQQDGGR